MTGPEIRDRVARATAAADVLYASAGAGRSVESIAGLAVTSLGIEEPWGCRVQALSSEPDPYALLQAVRELRRRDTAFCIATRFGGRGIDLRGFGPTMLLDLVVMACPLAGRATPVLPQGVRVRALAEGAGEPFRTAYGMAFRMRPALPEALVRNDDIGRAGMVHLVAERDGRAVGTALLRLVEGTGYVSAVGVLPGERRRGVGAALVLSAMDRAGAAGCDLGMLHADAGAAPFYRSLGVEPVDTHRSLTPMP